MWEQGVNWKTLDPNGDGDENDDFEEAMQIIIRKMKFTIQHADTIVLL